MGRNSGVKPTARATANKKDSNASLCNATQMTRMNKTKKNTARMINIPKCFMLRSNSVSAGRVASRSAMAPNAVCAPVFRIRTVPVPLTTEVPRKTRSGASGLPFGGRA